MHFPFLALWGLLSRGSSTYIIFEQNIFENFKIIEILKNYFLLILLVFE